MIAVAPDVAQQTDVQRLQVELVEHNPGNAYSGISRYTREVHEFLSDQINAHVTTSIDPPLAKRLGFLHHLPRGVRGHQPGNTVHFMQLMGCAQMLWHPVHPSIATVHDLGPVVCKADDPACHGFDRMLLDLQVAGLKRMDHLVAVSEFTRRGLVDTVGIAPEKITVIHHGIKHHVYRPINGARETLSARYSAFAAERQGYDLLYVGNELPRKNLGVLLEAIVLLRQRGLPVRLLKVGGAGGERWHKQFLHDMHSLHVEDSVVLLGSVPEAELPLFYNAADLFVTPSLLEGFGWPVLEAMACGIPVVCSNAGSLPEIVGESALLFEPDDVDNLVANMMMVFGDSSLRNRMIEQGFDRSRFFDWKESIKKLISVYRLFA